MDIEFHYYITYLVAARAGFGPEDALTIAYASQYTDDNDLIMEINKGQGSAYRNYISQTMNILKPKSKLFRIYPVFHFIPGEPTVKTAWRKDGKMHWLNTTPNSPNANRIVDEGLASNDLYRAGIAIHGYADTWAHQNFLGYYDSFNDLKGPLSTAIPNIGHAEAGHNPDWPALVWQDKRMLQERVDNKARFRDAAKHLFQKLARFVDPTISSPSLRGRTTSLVNKLSHAIGDQDQCNDYAEERVARYRDLAATDEFGGQPLPVYSEETWGQQAINEWVRGLRDRSDFALARWDPLTDVYTWKNPRTYKKTHWYKFQEAVKNHQAFVLAYLQQNNLKGLELPEF